MGEGWIIFGICMIFIIGAALPLIGKRDAAPPPPAKETLRDWRNEQQG
jgi:hypothetical protein